MAADSGMRGNTSRTVIGRFFLWSAIIKTLVFLWDRFSSGSFSVIITRYKKQSPRTDPANVLLSASPARSLTRKKEIPMKRKLKITLNSPLVLIFAFTCAAAALIGSLTGEKSTALLFICAEILLLINRWIKAN